MVIRSVLPTGEINVRDHALHHGRVLVPEKQESTVKVNTATKGGEGLDGALVGFGTEAGQFVTQFQDLEVLSWIEAAWLFCFQL